MPFPALDEVSNLTFDDLPIGTRVKVVADMVDMYFFYGETGIVEKNTGNYLGVIVRFDEPRHFTDGYIQETFNFNPKNLEIIGAASNTA